MTGAKKSAPSMSRCKYNFPEHVPSIFIFRGSGVFGTEEKGLAESDLLIQSVAGFSKLVAQLQGASSLPRACAQQRCNLAFVGAQTSYKRKDLTFWFWPNITGMPEILFL